MHVDTAIRELISQALDEDLGTRGDLTTKYFLQRNKSYSASLVFKEDGILCGKDIVNEVFRQAAPRSKIAWKAKEGQRIGNRTVIARIQGSRRILTAERTALNFLQHLCGIASLTSRYVAKVRGTRARIYDTRKTLPGWRALAKYAVRTGGGQNHRMGLYAMAMLKDNHISGLRAGGQPPASSASKDAARERIKSFRRSYPRVPIEIEAKTTKEVELALYCGADIVMLDNMGSLALRRNIRLIRNQSAKTQIEVSGNVRLSNVAQLARMGPDRISIGRLTHSAPALDISMRVEP